METLYEKSSLILNPGVYDTGKVYCTKPFDGSGDLTFTRNSNATRVNADGLVEKVRTNEVLYSQDFTQTAWTALSTATLSSTTTVTPAGTTDAVRLTATGAVQDLRTVRTITNGVTYTNSAYVRRVSGTGIINILDVNGTTSNIAVTSEWQRFSVTSTATSTTGRLYIRIQTSGDVIEVWGCQMEVSDFGPTDYIPTTSAAVSVGPTANVPRLDYLGGGCARLLLEPQTTNVMTYSCDITNAVWDVNTGITRTANTTETTAPTGYYEADKFERTTDAVGYNYLRQSIASANNNTFSFFVKKGNWRYIGIRNYGGGLHDVFDLDTQTFTNNSGSVLNYSDYGNGWYRISSYSTASISTQLGACLAQGTNGNENWNAYGKYAYFWGFQAEAKTYPTSVIPTLGASVTRLADMVGKSAFPTSILNTTTAHSGFFELKPNAIETSGFQVFGFDNNTYSSYIKIYADTTGRHRMAASSGGSSGVSAWGVANQYNKFAWSYDGAGNVKFFCNGVASVNYSITLNAMTYFGAGEKSLQTNYTNQSFKQILLFNSKLTDAQLAELTTL